MYFKIIAPFPPPSNLKFRSDFDDIKYTLLRFDGGARGNPGPAGCGFTMYSMKYKADGEVKLVEYCHGSWFMTSGLEPTISALESGTKELSATTPAPSFTNNEAEYLSLLLGLTTLTTNENYKTNIKELYIEGDSDLIVQQLIGKYKCKSENLQWAHHKALELLRGGNGSAFKVMSVRHIPRKVNSRADELANIAMDCEVQKITNFDGESQREERSEENKMSKKDFVEETVVRKVLLTLPGISSTNIDAVTSKCPSIRDLLGDWREQEKEKMLKKSLTLSEINKMNIAELREEWVRRGLGIKGKLKKTLVAELREEINGKKEE